MRRQKTAYEDDIPDALQPPPEYMKIFNKEYERIRSIKVDNYNLQCRDTKHQDLFPKVLKEIMEDYVFKITLNDNELDNAIKFAIEIINEVEKDNIPDERYRLHTAGYKNSRNDDKVTQEIIEFYYSDFKKNETAWNRTRALELLLKLRFNTQDEIPIVIIFLDKCTHNIVFKKEFLKRSVCWWCAINELTNNMYQKHIDELNIHLNNNQQTKEWYNKFNRNNFMICHTHYCKCKKNRICQLDNIIYNMYGNTEYEEHIISGLTALNETGILTGIPQCYDTERFVPRYELRESLYKRDIRDRKIDIEIVNQKIYEVIKDVGLIINIPEYKVFQDENNP